MSDFLTLFEKKEVSVELIWKFLVIILTTDNPEEKTRMALSTSLIKRLPTITYITDALEPFLERKRTALSGYKKDYFVLDWVAVLFALTELTGFNEEETEIIIEYLYDVVTKCAQRPTKLDIPTDIFSKKTQMGKLLTVGVEIYPPLLFVLLLIFFLVSGFPDADEKNTTEPETFLSFPIPDAVTNFFGSLMVKIPQDIGSRLLGQIHIKKVGPLSLMKDESPSSEKEPDSVDIELPLKYSRILKGFFLFAQDGYLVDQDRLFLSLEVVKDIDTSTSIQLILPLKDGTTITKQVPIHDVSKYFE